MELALGNAGWAYYKLGDFEKSLFDFQQAEQQARELGSDHDQIVWSTNTGLSFYRLGDLNSAEVELPAGVGRGTRFCNDKELIAGDAHRARVAVSSNAANSIWQSSRVCKRFKPLVPGVANLKSWRHCFFKACWHAGKTQALTRPVTLLQVYRDPVTMPSLREEVENAIAKYYARVHDTRAAERWFRKSVATFEEQRSSLKDDEMKLPFFANADALYKDYAQFLIDSHRSRDALQFLDRGRALTLEEGLRTQIESNSSDAAREPVDAQAVARKLNATILFYALSPDRSYLWAIDRHHTRLFSLPGQLEIDSHVKRYQAAILRSSDPIRENNEDGRYLFNVLVAPVAATFPKGQRSF